MQEFKDMLYRKELADKGFKYPAEGYFTCPHCGVIYLPIFPSKEQAFYTDNIDAQEQWLSHCCSTKCYNQYIGLEFLNEWGDEKSG